MKLEGLCCLMLLSLHYKTFSFKFNTFICVFLCFGQKVITKILFIIQPNYSTNHFSSVLPRRKYNYAICIMSFQHCQYQ